MCFPRRSILLAISVLCSMASATLAQRIADPNAIDLTPYLQTIDSIGREAYIYEPHNIGDQNADGVDDLYLRYNITDDTGRSQVTNELGLLHADGTMLTQPLNIENFVLAADIDGDGRKDVFDYVQGFQFRYLLHHGSQMLSDNDTLLFANGEGRAAVVADLDEDGDPDLVTNYSGSIMALYDGPVAVNSILRPKDSIRTSGEHEYAYNLLTAVGRFLPDHKPRLLTISSFDTGNWHWVYSATLYPPLSTVSSLWDAQPSVVFRDTIDRQVFVYTTPSLVADVTGDGLDDLIVTDTAHVYVFAGGPDFGSRALRKDEATLVLTSPALLDSAHFAALEYPLSLSFLGDISGSGIPYFAVGGRTGDRSTAYIYAGGSAMDPYYDASISRASSGIANLTPVKIGSQRTAALVTSRDLLASKIEYLHNGTELIPHTQRSSVMPSRESREELLVSYAADGSAVVSLPSTEHAYSVYSALGTKVLQGVALAPTLTLHRGALAAGVYWVQSGSQVARVIMR